MKNQNGKLRNERSLHSSGKLLKENAIPVLKEREYIVKNYDLDGDAPTQFIMAYFDIPDSGIHRSSTKSWILFIAKTAEKWYPHESVIEYMINRIGQSMGLRMNKIELVKANGEYPDGKSRSGHAKIRVFSFLYSGEVGTCGFYS